MQHFSGGSVSHHQQQHGGGGNMVHLQHSGMLDHSDLGLGTGSGLVPPPDDGHLEDGNKSPMEANGGANNNNNNNDNDDEDVID